MYCDHVGTMYHQSWICQNEGNVDFFFRIPSGFRFVVLARPFLLPSMARLPEEKQATLAPALWR